MFVLLIIHPLWNESVTQGRRIEEKDIYFFFICFKICNNKTNQSFNKQSLWLEQSHSVFAHLKNKKKILTYVMTPITYHLLNKTFSYRLRLCSTWHVLTFSLPYVLILTSQHIKISHALLIPLLHNMLLLLFSVLLQYSLFSVPLQCLTVSNLFLSDLISLNWVLLFIQTQVY